MDLTGLTPTDARWQDIAALYDSTPDMTNLEHGYWSVMATPVKRAYLEHIERINAQNAVYARGRMPEDVETVRRRVAAGLGCSIDEIALTRGAADSDRLLISGYNRLKPGDAVLYSDHDYHAAQYAMKWLSARRGVTVLRIAIPEQASQAEVVALYETKLIERPDIRMMLLTHVCHRSGRVLPVAEIIAMAKARGVDVILDAAHSLGQIAYRIDDLGADFAAFNLHKWWGAPLGIGFLYIRKNRITDIDADMADEDWPGDDIRARSHYGFIDFATILATPTAIDLHEQIGASAKQARLTYLRDYWVSRVRNLTGIEIVTPDEAGAYSALTSFRIAGREAGAIVTELRDRYRIQTVARPGLAKGPVVRVTVGMPTREGELDKLIAALTEMTTA
ncbi:aminotransferase class V-fold PLP-dependent enzyme [Lacibacterium aquatile]|uniref:Aminotransferase class V-fold PLP-dependent enzyme n=1 Tax=Lacibacterium aquatile TaxID=1168082 RepID=A0ABW5DNF9_9PROT